MKKSSKKLNFHASIEDVSIMRKFTILFLLMSLIPTIVLFYFYIQLRKYGSIQISADAYNVTLIFIVSGVAVGYFAMRSVIQKLIALTLKNKKTVDGILSPQKIEEMSEEKNELEVLAHAFTVITNRYEENLKNLEVAKSTLHSVMTKIGQGISKMQNIDAFLELILETITNALHGDGAVLMLLNTETSTLELKSSHGVKILVTDKMMIEASPDSEIKRMMDSQKACQLPEDLPELNQIKKVSRFFKEALMCSPLVLNGKTSGVLFISTGEGRKESMVEEELDLIFNVASQMAVAIQNSELSQDIEATYFETISALALAVDAKDPYSRGHLDRVAKYTVMIAKKLGLEKSDIKLLRDAARMHDLGKIGIPDEVLLKPGPLNEQEWEMMKKHPEIGEGIIKPIKSLSGLLDIIRHHHELLDGSGYPDGLKGDEIHPLVRITTVADIYDALTTNRSYRKKMSSEKAYEIMSSMTGKIDQDILETFYEALEEEGQLKQKAQVN